jgi:hypothetical protein
MNATCGYRYFVDEFHVHCQLLILPLLQFPSVGIASPTVKMNVLRTTMKIDDMMDMTCV